MDAFQALQLCTHEAPRGYIIQEWIPHLNLHWSISLYNGSNTVAWFNTWSSIFDGIAYAQKYLTGYSLQSVGQIRQMKHPPKKARWIVLTIALTISLKDWINNFINKFITEPQTITIPYTES